MKRALSFLPLFIFLFVTSAPAQKLAVKKLSLEDAILKQSSSLAPDNLRQLMWIPETDRFVFVEKKEESEVIRIGKPTNKEQANLLTLDEFNAELKRIDADQVKRFPRIKFLDKQLFSFDHNNTLYTFNIDSKKINKVNSYDKAAENKDIHKSQAIAYTKENNLYVSMPGKMDVAVTKNSKKDIVSGQAAHRYEFGISKGIFWSPSAKFLAFYHADNSKIADYPILKLDATPAKADMIKYPMAGGPGDIVTLGVYNTSSGEQIFLKTNPKEDTYLTNISWSPDDKYIFIAVLNRDQNHVHLKQYDASTGAFIKTLFEEKDDEYVEPKHALTFLPGKNDEFIWQSQRSGYNHLYHYHTDGKLINQLTDGPWVVTQLHGFDESGKTAFISTTKESPLERHLYSLDLKSKSLSQLTKGKGNHGVLVQDAGAYFLDNHTSSTVPRAIKLMETRKGKEVLSLLSSKDPLKEYGLGELKFFTLKAEDGQDLWCRMILPPNFDPKKKYPVIDYVYGGPGVQLLRDTWLGAAPLWMYYAAQEGFIVFTLENRGSANRGLPFEQVTFRKLGTQELEDQMVGVEHLKSLPYVDADRMGVHGWSYGGFMTTSLMTRKPGTFKAGVAGGPVIDWAMYEVMYTERYMDTPLKNKEGYEGANLISYVKDLQGKLMLIHGTSDDVVVWQHSLKFIQECVSQNKPVDYFVYPMHPHNVRGKDRLHLMDKVLTYFMENL